MLFLKTLSVDDGWDIFDMLKEIGTTENSFTNPVHEMTYEQFKKWLIQQEKWSREEDLPPGYVGQTIYWLYDGERPVGFGKIRHQLTEASRRSGGSIGYAIRPQCRRKGYGSGTLPEESSFYLSIGHPIAAVCIRTSTERPEALEAGDFILAGITTDELLNATSMAIEMKQKGVLGKPCPDYVDETVSMKVVRIIQGYVGVVNKMVWRKS